MKNILTLALLAGFGVAVICALLALRSQPTKLDPPVPLVQSPSAEKAPASRVIPADPAPPVTFAPRATGLAATPVRFPEVQPATTTNKLERLNQIREDFRKLAAGDPAAAMRAAKEIKDGTERETALLTLVTEWRQGDLGPPARRARMIAAFGLEAGMAIEIVSDPKLAVLWANELTDGVGRSIVLQQAASTLLATDPAAAFALSDQIPETERRSFVDSVFASWGAQDTDAALQYADQLTDPAEKAAAIAAVRTSAPVGIGAEIRLDNGYPVINRLLPGAAAEKSGQIQAGDRIVAVAQGDSSFVDARSLPLADVINMIRGAPNTILQLQVLGADAAEGSAPRTVAILRDQVKFKR